MAQQDEKNDVAEYKLSWLLLGCPGSAALNNKVRRRKSPRNVKAASSGTLELEGVIADFQNVQQFAAGHLRNQKGYNAVTKSNIKINSYMSDLTAMDAQLTAKSALERITKWLKTGADEYVFYYTGHGGPGCMGFAEESVLMYSELAAAINSAKFSNKKAPLVTIVIDACFSGSIYNDFKKYQQSKRSDQCANDKGVLFQVIYSSRADEYSYDETFSTWLFDKERVEIWKQYFINGVWNQGKWTNTFQFKDGTQHTGCFDFRPTQ